MSKTSVKRVIAMPSMAENKKIVAAAKADPDARPLTKTQLKAMVPIRSLRGRPKPENRKLLLSLAERREAELESGAVTAIPAGEVFARHRARIAR